MKKQDVTKSWKNYDSSEQLKLRKNSIRPYFNPQVDPKVEILRTLNLKGNEKILDIGCGFGDFLEYIKEKYPKTELHGIDISEGMINEAKNKNSNISFEVSGAENLPFEDNSLDVAVAKHMLYHVDNIKKAINEAYRVLKPNGKFAITLNSLANGSRSKIETYKQLIAYELGLELIHTSKRLNTENYKQHVDFQKFRLVEELKYFPKADLDKSEPMLSYINSYKEFFNPVPNDQQWNHVLGILKEKIDSQIKEKGILTEIFGYGIILLEKQQ